jgi:hypothetical protein
MIELIVSVGSRYYAVRSASLMVISPRCTLVKCNEKRSEG